MLKHFFSESSGTLKFISILFFVFIQKFKKCLQIRELVEVI